MNTTAGSNKQADRMTAEYGTSPEPCCNCGTDVWVDSELDLFVDVRALLWRTDGDRDAYLCPGTFTAHEV